jgi:exopolysaccharide biosynthesis WecB/TagA/CpsF family protein
MYHSNISNLGDDLKVDGWKVNIANMTELMKLIVAELKKSSASFTVCTLNLDHVVKLRRNAEFREAYSRAHYVTADGFPIVMLARLSGYRIERTTGADLIEPICRIAAYGDLPVFLLGSSLAALCAAGSRLATSCPDLDIRGAFAPPRGFDPASPLADEITDILSASGARICFVALGAPLQELFSARAMERTSGICFLPVGAGLDFLAGSQLRAPSILQYLKLEWAWRLVLNPIRLSGRYARCAIVFFELILKHYRSPRLHREQNV